MLCAVLALAPCVAQKTNAPVPEACGPLGFSMAVNLNKSQHALTPPEPGEARIYFIQDSGEVFTLGYPTTRIGIDGKWVGANKKNSYFSVSVEPGEQHLCAAIQSSLVGDNIEFAHFTAAAGQVYYYRTRLIFSEHGPEYLGLGPVDSDEARYLIEEYPLATAHAKK